MPAVRRLITPLRPGHGQGIPIWQGTRISPGSRALDHRPVSLGAHGQMDINSLTCRSQPWSRCHGALWRQIHVYHLPQPHHQQALLTFPLQAAGSSLPRPRPVGWGGNVVWFGWFHCRVLSLPDTINPTHLQICFKKGNCCLGRSSQLLQPALYRQTKETLASCLTSLAMYLWGEKK